MAAASKRLFWDRQVDLDGRTIRADVRQAAQEQWQKFERMTASFLGDASDAAEILETCVARVSRYLDERRHGLFTQCISALLCVSFRRALYSHARKRQRLRAAGDIATLAQEPVDLRWNQKLDAHIDFEKLVRRLSKRSRAVLALRHAGYKWKEIAALLGVSMAVAKSALWREIQRLRSDPSLAGPYYGHHENRRT
jgi:DNA-directed RNA polymerase specialized sigma24 family protein